MNTQAQSKCCNAKTKVVGSPDFGDGSPDDIHTMHWECEKCGQPCDSMGQEDINQDPINALKSAKEAIENLNKKPSLGDFVFKEYKGRFIPIGHIASIKVSLGNSPELIIET